MGLHHAEAKIVSRRHKVRPVRDVIDTRTVREVRTGAGHIVDSVDLGAGGRLRTSTPAAATPSTHDVSAARLRRRKIWPPGRRKPSLETRSGCGCAAGDSGDSGSQSERCCRSLGSNAASAPYERAYPDASYVRGLAYLNMGKGAEAAAEFGKIALNEGTSWGATWVHPNWGQYYAPASLGGVRGYALAGDQANAQEGI